LVCTLFQGIVSNTRTCTLPYAYNMIIHGTRYDLEEAWQQADRCPRIR